MGNAGRDQIKNEVLLVVGLVLGRHMVGWLVTHAPGAGPGFLEAREFAFAVGGA